MFLRALIAITLLALPVAHATEGAFTKGPLIAEFGEVARVEAAEPLPANASFKVAFNINQAADEAGRLNRRLDSAARFLNMHAAAGVPAENIHVAIVVHGPAVRDLTRADAGEQNAALVAALQERGARIYVCGQTAASMDIEASELLPGVRMALSAMTAHALLQQQGYTLNPF